MVLESPSLKHNRQNGNLAQLSRYLFQTKWRHNHSTRTTVVGGFNDSTPLKKYASKWEASPNYGWKYTIFETTIFYNHLLQPPDIFLETTSGSTDPVVPWHYWNADVEHPPPTGCCGWQVRKYADKKQLTFRSLTARPWKMMVGRQLSYWEGDFSLWLC